MGAVPNECNRPAHLDRFQVELQTVNDGLKRAEGTGKYSIKRSCLTLNGRSCV